MKMLRTSMTSCREGSTTSIETKPIKYCLSRLYFLQNIWYSVIIQ